VCLALHAILVSQVLIAVNCAVAGFVIATGV
jgi:hypothetical protein